MENGPATPAAPSAFSRSGPWLVAAAVWTALLVAVAVVAVRSGHDRVVGLARAAAETALEKDLAYRSWAAEHGGVYVPPTPATPPNPHLGGVARRDVATTDGQRLTLVNPAYLTRQVNEIGRERFGTHAHITSLNPIRPGNRPDPWEEQALRAFEAGAAEAAAVVPIDGEPHLRFMRPLVTEPACLQCHAAQGYRAGQIRGGISESVPLAPYEAGFAALRRGMLWGGFGVWALGVAALLLLRRTVTRHGRALARREAWFRNLVEQSGEALFLADRDGRLVDVNGAACRMLGWSREELLGKDLGDVTPRFQDPGALAAAWERLAEAGAILAESECVRRDGGAVPVEVLASLATVGGRPHLLALARDVTAREGRESVLAARLQLLEGASRRPADELLRMFLDTAEQLTGSAIGFCHFVEEDEKALTLQVWSTNTLAGQCAAEGKGRHYPLSEAGVWGDAVRERRPVIHNDYPATPGRKGLPAGHAPVVRELVVPVFRHGRIVAVLGVGNKPSPYTEADAAKVSEFADMVWDIIERRRAEEDLAWEQRFTGELAALQEAVGDPATGIREVAALVLASVRRLTGSEHGYVSQIDPVTGGNVGHTLTDMMGKACQLPSSAQKIVFPRRPDGTYPKLWGHALNTGEPFFTNHPRSHPAFSGIPWGHVSLERFLSVPVMADGAPIGQIALANAAEGYTRRHLDAVCRVAEVYATVLLRRRGRDGN